MIDIGKTLLETERVKEVPNLFFVSTKNKKSILHKPEKLRLICNKCGEDWIELRPAEYNVRCEKGNNFLINRLSPYDKKLFKCPECKNKKSIGRLSLVTVVKNKHGVVN